MTKIFSPTCALPQGSFLMGACDEDKFANDTERPRRLVEIVRPFEIGIFPVTVAEWEVFDPNHDQSANDLPVVNVSHRDIARYLAWLNESETGRPWRLPTEEEWEYACRAGTEAIFNTGDQLDKSEANFLFDESIERVGPGCRTAVATYPPNLWGLHDCHGNVAEWTSSLWRPDLRPETAAVPHRYTIRGGAWDYLPRLLRSSWRDGLSEITRRDNLGFRLARDAGLTRISHTLSSRDAARNCPCEARTGFPEGRFPPNCMRTYCPRTIRSGTKHGLAAASRSRMGMGNSGQSRISSQQSEGCLPARLSFHFGLAGFIRFELKKSYFTFPLQAARQCLCVCVTH